MSENIQFALMYFMLAGAVFLIGFVVSLAKGGSWRAILLSFLGTPRTLVLSVAVLLLCLCLFMTHRAFRLSQVNYWGFHKHASTQLLESSLEYIDSKDYTRAQKCLESLIPLREEYSFRLTDEQQKLLGRCLDQLERARGLPQKWGRLQKLTEKRGLSGLQLISI